jgi:predicted patatin/cPLA2 family phospholipase
MFETQALLRTTLSRTWIKRDAKKMKWKMREYKRIRDKWINKGEFYSVYWKYISHDRNDIKISMPADKKVIATTHAKFRFIERFETKWFDMKDIEYDVCHWLYHIKLIWDNKYETVGKIWTYIMTKDRIIITMFPKV